MKPCDKFYRKGSTLDSTFNSNKSTINRNKAESSKYYQLNIGYSHEKECIQLHFTPQEAYKDDKENSLDACETFSNHFAINTSGTNKQLQNSSAQLTGISSNDDKKEKKHKNQLSNINHTSTSLSSSSVKLTKIRENKKLSNKRKMTVESDRAESSKDDAGAKPLKGRFKEASTDPKDVVVATVNKKVKSKKIQTSIVPAEDMSLESKKKKNKGTYVEPQEIYSVSNQHESVSSALIPSLHMKNSLSTKSSIIRKHRHRRRKHHRHHRHRSGTGEGKVIHSVSSATVKSQIFQEIIPMKNKSKGLGFFFLKNKLLWPVRSKNYAGEDGPKDEIVSCVAEEINKCKIKIKNKVDNCKDLLEVRKHKQRHVSTETLDCGAVQAKGKGHGGTETVIIKKYDGIQPDDLNSLSDVNCIVAKKHRRVKDADDKLKAGEEVKLKRKHSRLRRDSRNELPKVVSSKIKHKDGKYKKTDAGVIEAIRSSDGLTGSRKHKHSKTELEFSQYKNEMDNKREKEGSTSNRHKKRSKNKYAESEILVSKEEYQENKEESASLVAESSKVTRKKKHIKERDSNSDIIKERDKSKKKMKNKKVDTSSLVDIKQKHSKHKHRKSSHDSTRSRHSSKNDKNNSDARKKERQKSSSRDTKKSDAKKHTKVYEDIFDETWDDRKSIKISRDQLREFLQEITGNVDIKESKTVLNNKSDKDNVKTDSLRKEVSFSHLNLNPVAALYTAPVTHIKGVEPKSSPLRASPSIKGKKQAKSKKKDKELDEQSVVSEAVTKKEKSLYVSGKRFQSKSSTRSGVSVKNLEKVKKQLQHNGSFSVKGVQPREETKPASSIKPAKKVAQRHRQKLEKVVLSVMEIKPAKYSAEELETDKPNKSAKHDRRDANNIPLSKKRKNREAKPKQTGGDSSDAASKSSASDITAIQAIYLADMANMEKEVTKEHGCDYNSVAAIQEIVTSPDKSTEESGAVTPLIQQIALRKDVPKQRGMQNKNPRSADADRELLPNNSKILKPNGGCQQKSSLERPQMQLKNPTKRDCQKILQTSPASSREPSTDGRSLTDDREVVDRSKASRSKYSLKRLKCGSITSIKGPKSYKRKTLRHTSPINSGNEINSDLKLHSIYNYKPSPEASPSLSSGFSVTSMEQQQMRGRNVFRTISNKKALLQKNRPRSEQKRTTLASVRNVQTVNPRIKEYAKHCERRQRLSRESSASSKSSSGKGNSREINQTYSRSINNNKLLQQIHPKNQLKTNQLKKDQYVISVPLAETDSFQATSPSKIKNQNADSTTIPSTASKLQRNQQSMNDMLQADPHSSQRQWHSLLADAEGYLSRVQSNLQDILSGDMTGLTKITEETSQESMKHSNLSHSSRIAGRDSSFNLKKVGDQQPGRLFIPQEIPQVTEVRRRYPYEYGNNQERKTTKRLTEVGDGLSEEAKHKKRNKSGTSYDKPIYSPYCVAKGKILQIFNVETGEQPSTSTEIKTVGLETINRKSKEHIKQGATRSSFNDNSVIAYPCNAELEITPVKDTKNSSEERDSGDTEATSSNGSDLRPLPVITINTHLTKATNQNWEQESNHNDNQDKSSNNNEQCQRIYFDSDSNRIDGTKERSGFGDTNSSYHQTHSDRDALLLEEAAAANIENQEEEFRESKILLANSFKKSIMEGLQTASLLQQSNDVMQLIVDNSNEEELVQLDEIISKNVSNLVKEKVRSMLRFEEASESPDAKVLKRESSPTMYPKLNVHNESSKTQCRFDYDAINVKTRLKTTKGEDANFNNTQNTHHKQRQQNGLDKTQRETKNDTFVLVSKSSQECHFALSKPKANMFLTDPIFDDSEDDNFYSSKKPLAVNVIPKNSKHIQLSQVTYCPLTTTTHVDSIESSNNRIASNTYNTQRGLEARELTQHPTSSDYNNDYWENQDKKPSRTSKIPRTKNTSSESQPRSQLEEAKPRTAPSGKDQHSRAGSEMFRSSVMLTKFWAEKQENKPNAGSSCSTMVNSFRNKPSTCLFTKTDRKDNRMSTFEKRKQYGELLRRKRTRTRNQDCIYCCPQVLHGEEVGKIQSEKRVLPPRPPAPNLTGKYSEPSASKQSPAVRVLSSKDRRTEAIFTIQKHGESSSAPENCFWIANL